jgi:hypothetical protein
MKFRLFLAFRLHKASSSPAQVVAGMTPLILQKSLTHLEFPMPGSLPQAGQYAYSRHK